MPTSALKNQKTSDGLDDLYVDDWNENGGRIGMGILYLVFHYFPRLD